jgi:hypothetical protein
MSHRRTRKTYKFVLSANGTAELQADGETIWASDDDPDLADEMGADFLTVEYIGDVLDYLVDINMLSLAQRDDCWVVEPGDAPAAPADESRGDPLEGEYLPANDEEASA